MSEQGLPRTWVVFDACPKCGATVPRVNYRNESGNGVADGGWPRSCSDQKGVEHFHVECWRCNHRWAADMEGKRR